MSQSNVRLDPATLRKAADAVASFRDKLAVLARASDVSAEDAVEAVCLDIEATFQRIANEETFRRVAEAEARPPRLSDWLAAMCDSRLGEPWLTAPHSAFWRSETICASVITPKIGARFVRVETCNAEGARLSVRDYATPTELTAALDRLAEEVSRG